jgi:hypothetical protein
MSPAREGTGPVEHRASGAAAKFDGNLTSQLLSWLFPNDKWMEQNVPDMVEELMMWTESGHLAWAVFPPLGYRI